MAAEKSAPTTSPELAAVDQAIGDLVAKGMKALAEYASYDQAQIDHIVAKAAVAALDQHGDLADLAVKETGRDHLHTLARSTLHPIIQMTNHNLYLDQSRPQNAYQLPFQ